MNYLSGGPLEKHIDSISAVEVAPILYNNVLRAINSRDDDDDDSDDSTWPTNSLSLNGRSLKFL